MVHSAVNIVIRVHCTVTMPGTHFELHIFNCISVFENPQCQLSMCIAVRSMNDVQPALVRGTGSLLWAT
jgi:hypothetical protein